MFNFHHQKKSKTFSTENVKLNFLWNRTKFFKNITNIQFDIWPEKYFDQWKFSMFIQYEKKKNISISENVQFSTENDENDKWEC